MRLCRTDRGLARLERDELALLDLPHPDLAALFADETTDAAKARELERLPLASARLLAPVARPAAIAIVGFNYKAHIAETGTATPASPALAVFSAPAGVTAAWDADVVLPRGAPAMVDYEGELAVVIGRRTRDVRASDAWRCVGGLTVVNDFSARDVQRRAMAERDMSLGLGKLFPGFKPCGPGVVTLDALATASLDLELETLVNGERRQRGRTSDLLFAIPELVEAASRGRTLEPGDLICTGTPGGVGAAIGVFLKPGDVVEVRIAGIGALRNRMVSDG